MGATAAVIISAVAGGVAAKRQSDRAARALRDMPQPPAPVMDRDPEQVARRVRRRAPGARAGTLLAGEPGAGLGAVGGGVGFGGSTLLGG